MMFTYIILVMVSSALGDSSSKYTERLVERSTWTRNIDSKAVELSIKPARHGIVAHTVSAFCNSKESCVRILRGIEQWQTAIGFDMIGYNFLIGGDGKIYEGRGWGKTGAAVSRFNCAAVSVAFIGNFEADALGENMVESFNILMDEGVRRGDLAADYKLFAHNQLINTKSPGQHIIERIRSWPHWSVYSKSDNMCNRTQ